MLGVLESKNNGVVATIDNIYRRGYVPYYLPNLPDYPECSKCPTSVFGGDVLGSRMLSSCQSCPAPAPQDTGLPPGLSGRLGSHPGMWVSTGAD